MPKYDVFRWRGMHPLDQLNDLPFDRIEDAEDCVRRFEETHPFPSAEIARIRVSYDTAEATTAGDPAE